MTTWFISDMHLDVVQRPDITRLLLDFLADMRGKASALYILGDCFEYWVGDDILGTPAGKLLTPVIQALQATHRSGIKLYFQHGNRDFLVGDRFARLSGCVLLPEQQVLNLYGTPTLLMHGDTLCTDDTEYQKVRHMLRSPAWQARFLALPLEERIRQAENMRQQSRQTTPGKPAMLQDVNAQAVRDAMIHTRTRCLIHGHTHRPACHPLQLAGQAAQRLVLGDWQPGRASFLRFDDNGPDLVF